jgi:monofunctional biosynthetic peptidoglycan transglycosylase
MMSIGSGRRIAVALASACLCSVTLGHDGHVEAGEAGEGIMVIDFSAERQPWRSIDDAVMGGVSSSEMEISNGVAVFRGEVSLANNGGFASVRSAPRDHDLSPFDGLILRVRGDGKRYLFRLRTSRAFDGVSYQAPLEPAADVWHEVVIPFAAFEPVFRGRRVPNHPPLDPAKVQTFGLLIAGRQTGPFRLELEWIRGFRDGS